MDNAAVTISRSHGTDDGSKIHFDIEWQGNRLKMEMTLEDFALLITGRGHCPATVTRWRSKPAN